MNDAVEAMLGQWRRERPDVDASTMAVFGRLHRCYALYVPRAARVVEEHGINWAAFEVLAALRRRGHPYRMTAGELARDGLVSSGGLTLRTDRLVEAGLVVRERGPEDRRVVYCRLTAEGLRVVDEVTTAHFANEQEMLACLDAEDRITLSTLLARLEAALLSTAGRAEALPG